MVDRKSIDWAAVETCYRTGSMSLRKIAEAHGCSEKLIRNKAAENSWERDVSRLVRQSVRSRLARETLPTVAPAATVDLREVVDAAARRGVEVIRQHRAGLTRMTENLTALEEKLEGLIGAIDNLKALDLAQSVLASMAMTRAHIIKLERQAFDLDDQPDQAPAAANVAEMQRRITIEIDTIFADIRPQPPAQIEARGVLAD